MVTDAHANDPILSHLTAPQLAAVTHADGPMLVVAGAGSGKTRVVTRRIAWLIREGARPQQILAMTFTNKAASEMKDRVAELTGESPRWVGTFHSACARFLRFDLEKLGEGRDGRFTIFDDADQTSLLKKCLANAQADDKSFKPRAVLSRISRAKSDLITPADYGDGSWYDSVVAKAYAEYEKRLRAMNAVDFDDLLVLTVRMLEKVPGLREKYQARFRYLLIDEYQDTNRTQYRLMKLLANQKNNVHATGDPDQSIYSWRGADYRNIMDFTKDYPQARTVRLEQNYRSTKAILTVSNKLIRHNSDRLEKDLFTENPAGDKLALACLASGYDEADWVGEQVKELAGEVCSLKDMAIFYRTNAQSRAFEDTFMREGIPYQIIGGIRFYERKEIKDFLAYLKVLVNARDDVNLARILSSRPTGVGAKTFLLLQEAAAVHGEGVFAYLQREDFTRVYPGRASKKLTDFALWCRNLSAIPQKPVDLCVRAILEHSGLVLHFANKAAADPVNEDRLDNLETFVGRATEFSQMNPDGDLATFLEDVALVADVDQLDRETDKISLMTLHSAKGLEFPTVFLVGLENGLLPHKNADTDFAKEEERRLFYVGITRAKERVFISHAMTRLMWGQVDVSMPSMFLDELPHDMLHSIDYTGNGNHGERAAEDDDWFGLAADDNMFADEFPVDGESLPFTPVTSLPARRRSGATKTSSLKPGDHVNHATFGRGKILSIKREQAVIQFFAVGTKLLQLDVAKITKC